MLVLTLPLLATVVAGVSVTTVEPFIERHDNEGRIVAHCFPDRMEVHVTKDFHLFTLRGDEPECQPTWGTFVDYDGTQRKVKNWSLPLREDRSGPCGMEYVRVNNSALWAFETTIYEKAEPYERRLQCVKIGVLDKRGARIRVEQITPTIRELNGTLEAPTEVHPGATINAFFHHRFPIEADISLHPIHCWLVNDRRATRMPVIVDGCPTREPRRNRTYATLGSETSSGTTNNNTSVYFNAEDYLFSDEDAHDLPPFRLQCSVMPCKGNKLSEQIIGVQRCPAISVCQFGRSMTVGIPELFEVNQDFSLIISNTTLPNVALRSLGMVIYPWPYQLSDTNERERVQPPKVEAGWPWLLIAGIVLAAVAACGTLAFLCGRCIFNKRMAQYVRSTIVLEEFNDHVYPTEKQSDRPIFEEEGDLSVSIEQPHTDDLQ